MNYEKLEADIHRWHDEVARADALIDQLSAIFGDTPDSYLTETIWSLIGAYKAALVSAYGPVDEWLDWWWHECNLGARPKQAGLPGEPMRTIATINDLFQLITDDIKISEA